MNECKHKWSKWITKYNGWESKQRQSYGIGSQEYYTVDYGATEYRKCKTCGKTQIHKIEIIKDKKDDTSSN